MMIRVTARSKAVSSSELLPLFPTEAQIAERVLGVGKFEKWQGIAPELERDGFPKVEALFGGRYWPSCEAWFQVKHRLLNLPAGRLGKEDGGRRVHNQANESAGTPVAHPQRRFTHSHLDCAIRIRKARLHAEDRQTALCAR
jgi:hypothetical protein